MYLGFLSGTSGQEPACPCRGHKRYGFDPWIGKIPWRRAWQPTPLFLLENPMDRGAWWATVRGVAKRRTRRKRLSTPMCIIFYIYSRKEQLGFYPLTPLSANRSRSFEYKYLFFFFFVLLSWAVWMKFNMIWKEWIYMMQLVIPFVATWTADSHLH